MSSIKRIGVLTSGGDAPGMNAAIRSVVRAALYNGISVTGIKRGYAGLIKGDFVEMTSRDVGNIIQRGGTILRTARSQEFMTKEGRYTAFRNLVEAGIDALVVIGGDGTFKGAKVFTEEYNFPIVGLPGTIDNDLYGTDMTIGYDTAINTVVEAIDKIRDTASSHDRLFFVEVMGRDAGFIALRSAIACGAEDVLVPEVVTDMDEVCENLVKSVKRTKNSGVVIVS
ncbi:MAG TPA: ATP-dependent 6-phosphofructokinase, partial [Bacteroidales bacterium]|nr:ATP-dependent 6-phosphofructokinase [Bacteroidales bacterium]